MPKVEREIAVQAPVDTVYRTWHDFGNFPRFMENIEEVRVVGHGRSHWKAKGPLGAHAEWDAQVTMDEPNQAIGWRSIDNTSVKTAGRVNFEQRNGTTLVRVILEYEAPAGPAGNLVTGLFGNLDNRVEQDLRRFKDVVEQQASPGASLANEGH